MIQEELTTMQYIYIYIYTVWALQYIHTTLTNCIQQVVQHIPIKSHKPKLIGVNSMFGFWKLQIIPAIVKLD